MSLQDETETLNDLKTQYNETLNDLEDKLEEYENATDADDILNQVNAFNETLIKLEAQINVLQQSVNHLTNELLLASNTSVNARNAANQALLDAEAAQALAEEMEAIFLEAGAIASLANSNFNEQNAYSMLTEAIVSSYAVCSATGEWVIPGNPYCLGTSMSSLIMLF